MRNFTFFKNRTLFYFSCFLFSLPLFVNASVGIVPSETHENNWPTFISEQLFERNNSVLDSNREQQLLTVCRTNDVSFTIGNDICLINETLRISNASTRVFLFVPNAGFNGVPIFSYKEEEGYGLKCTQVTVELRITAPPVTTVDCTSLFATSVDCSHAHLDL
jgi:hypothetical protein